MFKNKERYIIESYRRLCTAVDSNLCVVSNLLSTYTKFYSHITSTDL